MPFINVKTNVKLTEDNKNELLTALTKSITTLPGKSESHLMCAVEDGIKMMFHGDASQPTAFVEVKILHSSAREAYAALTEKICVIMKDTAGVEGKYCYVKYEEIENWGFDGYMF